MKNSGIFLMLLYISINCIGQIHFEEGYFIDTKNQKTACYIKNLDRRKNPSEFQYKLAEDGLTKEANIKEIKEFGILNSAKYIRADVDIDTSFSMLNNLSLTMSPLWKHKQLFLKVLVEGKASLYYYYNGDYERFFYSINDTLVNQLVFKEYLYKNGFIAENNSFHQQLLNDINCSNTTINSIKHVDYNTRALTKYFVQYNSCVDSTYKITENVHTKGELNFGISAGFDYSALSISQSGSYGSTTFDPELSYRFGMEMEYILPFHRHKWGIAIEPVYQSYRSQKQSGAYYATVDYRAINFSGGIKHYFYLNTNDTKFYINFILNSIFCYDYDSKIEFTSYYNYYPETSYLEIGHRPNFAIGAGFSYKRFYTEIRYCSNHEFISKYLFWASQYEKVSFIIRYKLIRI